MRVLVTAASKHGSTAQIAEVIADVVRSSGHDVVVEESSSVHELGAFDACAVGSAVYDGHWMGAAREFVKRIDRSRLGFGERALVRAQKVPEGDYRDWAHVRRRSLGVVTQLDALQASSAAGPGR